MRDMLLPQERLRAIQEELALFFLEQVINPEGEFYAVGN